MSNLEDLFQLLERCKQIHALQLVVDFVNMDRERYGRNPIHISRPMCLKYNIMHYYLSPL